jgi:hypothetical protein
MQRLNRSPHRGARQAARSLEAAAKLDRFREAVDDMKLVALGLGNQHAATVRSQIQRSVKLCRIGRGRRGWLDRIQERARTSWTLGRHDRPPIST